MSHEDLRIKTVIVDGDEDIQERIEDVLDRYTEFDLVSTCHTGEQAIAALHNHLPDLIFLETELPDMSGFDVIQRMHPVRPSQFVFITHSRHHAIRAFEYFAFDYILKPFDSNRLHLTLMKVKEDFYKKNSDKLQDKLNALFRYVHGNQDKRPQQPMNGGALIPVKMSGRIYFIKEEEIQYIVAAGYYIEIHANGKKHLLRQSLTSISERFNERKFIRIHRSVIINISYLKEINKLGANDFSVKMADDATFRISKSYKGNVFQKIGIRN
ncbi:MAG: LytTR family DNA-binding domain-containing protein [Saprospiraceae bacterium]|nr:LytTR family DNA-binding domain-containing protein [Saprospiraceae bacterium]